MSWVSSRYRSACLAACVATVAGCGRGGLPVADTTPAASLPAAVIDTATPFRAVVERQFHGAAERALLETAESTYPSTTEILRAAVSSPMDSTRTLPGDSLWWVSTFDGIRIPFAITARAVTYYLELTGAFRRGEDAGTGVRMLSSSFLYRAHVERRDSVAVEGETFHDVYVVEMELHWKNHCGNLCALWFDKTRTVVLTPRGRVLRVFGDGVPPVVVS